MDDVRIYNESNTVMPMLLGLILVIFFIGISIYILYEAVITDDIELTSAWGIALMTIAITLIVVIAAFAVIRINVSVTHSALRVGIFKGRLVPMTDIESFAIEEFSAMKDYLGWGIRIGRRGLGYIAAGTNKGMKINLKTGRSFLISTKRPFEFENALKMALRSIQE
jgi:hypothetical protein